MNALAAAIARPFAAAGDTLARMTSGVMRFMTRAAWGFSSLLGRTSINYQASVGDPTRNSIVIAVVGWIARNFPEAPVRIRRLLPDGGAEVIAPGPTGPGFMLRLLERPNPYFSGVLLWLATIVDLFSTGDAYWLKIRNDVGRVSELWWVPRRYIRAAWPDDGSVFISHYIYTVDGVDYRVEVRDVVHFRDGIDPANPRYGLSKLASLFREIYTDDEAANFTAVLLTNLGVPGVVIAPANTGSGGSQRTDPESVKTAFMEKFGGDRRGEPLVLTSPTDVKVLSFNPQEMQLRELRRIPEERITAVLGVSAIVAGLGAGLDRSTFTNFGEARRAAYQESIIPLQRLIAAELEVQLLTDFADLDRDPLDVDFDTAKASALQEALDSVWKRAESSATKGLITRAAFKQATGQPVGPEDEVYILPNNFSVLPATAATGGTGANPPPPGATPDGVPAPTPVPTRKRQAPGAEANGNGHGHGEEAETLWSVIARREDASSRRDEAFATAMARQGSALADLLHDARTSAEAFDMQGFLEHQDRLIAAMSERPPINVEVQPAPVTIEKGAIAVTVEAPAPSRGAVRRRVSARDDAGRPSEVIEEPV